MSRTISVIGDGGWGTALALLLFRNEHRVTVWGPFPDYIDQVKETGENSAFLPGVELPTGIKWTADREEAVAGADAVVLAVPTKFSREVVSSFTDLIPSSALLVSVAKGFDQGTNMRMTQVAEELLQHESAALSGPSHAEEVSRGIPTAVTVASRTRDNAEQWQRLFSSRLFRVYRSDDVAGVELGGALKNVIALAVGVSDGLGFGDNTRAALVTRGLAEMTRLGCALGASASTFAGLSGMGDLIVTCTSRLSRNRAVGEWIGKGENIDQITTSMKQAVEGVWTCAGAKALAEREGVDVPIAEQVYQIIHSGRSPMDAVSSLLERDFGTE